MESARVIANQRPISRFVLQLCMLALGLMLGADLHAANYCVGSVAELREALDLAEADGEDSLVQLRTGYYSVTSNIVYDPVHEFVASAGKLTIRGGYDPDCSSFDPAAISRFTGDGTRHLLAMTQTGSVTLVGLSFEGVHVQLRSRLRSDCIGNGKSLNVRRSHIASAGLSIVSNCHFVLIDNSLFTDAVLDPEAIGEVAPGSAIDAYLIFSDFGAFQGGLTMINNTIINGSVTFEGCDGCYNLWVSLYNNIFARSGAAEVFATRSDVEARNNRFDWFEFVYNAQFVGNTGQNTDAAPDLDASYFPTVGSAMRNTGTADVPGGLAALDQAGGERVRFGVVDRGARESLVEPNPLVVTNRNSSGAGSLAWAVDNANQDSGFDTIRFNIAGDCPFGIGVTSSLQIRTPLMIDGWSQPGSVRNSDDVGWNGAPCIILHGPGSGIGIGIETMAQLGTGRITVRGLAFEGFALAIALAFGEDHAIAGNQFGGRVGSSLFDYPLEGNQQAIGLIGGGRTRIGGSTEAERNLIGGSTDVGVLITTFLGAGGDDNEVINNLIGVNKNGSSPLPNGTGIRVNGGYNVIQGNRIGGNITDGILLAGASAEGNRIVDNLIGAGMGNLGSTNGNGRMGVMLESDAHDNVIGPDNIVGNNGDDGIRVYTTAGGRNRITANQVAFNDALGIDIGANGVSANDLDPAACSISLGCPGNRGQNFPLVTLAERQTSGMVPTGRPINVRGTLRSTVGNNYSIEVFASSACDGNGSGHGEGRRLIGSFSMDIPNASYCPIPGAPCVACQNSNCTNNFSAYVAEIDVTVGDVLTLTATSPDGNTSEYSQCIPVTVEQLAGPLFADGFE